MATTTPIMIEVEFDDELFWIFDFLFVVLTASVAEIPVEEPEFVEVVDDKFDEIIEVVVGANVVEVEVDVVVVEVEVVAEVVAEADIDVDVNKIDVDVAVVEMEVVVEALGVAVDGQVQVEGVFVAHP